MALFFSDLELLDLRPTLASCVHYHPNPAGSSPWERWEGNDAKARNKVDGLSVLGDALVTTFVGQLQMLRLDARAV